MDPTPSDIPNLSWSVRRTLAERPQDLPLELLEALARDVDSDVRRALACRTQALPPALLEALARDPVPYVRHALARRAQEPTDVRRA